MGIFKGSGARTGRTVNVGTGGNGRRPNPIFDLQKFERRLFAGSLLSPGGDVAKSASPAAQALWSATAPRGDTAGESDPALLVGEFLGELREATFAGGASATAPAGEA